MRKFKIETHLENLKSKIDCVRNVSQAGVLLEANTVREKCDKQVDEKLCSDAFTFSAKEATSKILKSSSFNSNYKKGQRNMKKKFPPTLIKAAEKITRAELSQTPELSALVALDATLQATMTLLEFNYPCSGSPELENRDIADGIEEHIVDSISVLARALRGTLLAYYTAIQEKCDYHTKHQEISF